MSAVKKPEHALLNEHAQRNRTKTPDYSFIDRIVDGRKEFTASCKYQENVTKGNASSKNEAKRISAEKMLALLGVKNVCVSPKKVLEESVILMSNKLDVFDGKSLDIHLDKYLETREKDPSRFRLLFVGGFPNESAVDESDLPSDVNSPKSETLERLTRVGIDTVNSGNACSVFKAIIQEMKLKYFAEFLETAQNDRYAIAIKLNINLFTAGGMGYTPEEAIQMSCKNAIEFLYLFNL